MAVRVQPGAMPLSLSSLIANEPLNQRADFRDGGSETHDLRALGVADRVRLPARELPRMNGQKVEGILCFLKCTLNN